MRPVRPPPGLKLTHSRLVSRPREVTEAQERPITARGTAPFFHIKMNTNDQEGHSFLESETPLQTAFSFFDSRGPQVVPSFSEPAM